MGTIFSGPTSADPLIAYWNPAGMTLLHDNSLLLYTGATMISLDYDRVSPSGFDGTFFPRAKMFVAKPEIALGFVTDFQQERLRFGFSFTTPVLDGARWDLTSEGKPSSTRYYSIAGQQVHMFFRPVIAYQLHKMFSVGVGMDIVGIWLLSDSMTDFGAIFNQVACKDFPTKCSIDFPLQREDPTYQARTYVEGMGWGLGFVGSLLFTPAPWLRIGATYTSGGGRIGVPIDIEVTLPEAVVEYAHQNLASIKLPETNAQAEANTYSPMMIAAGVMVLPTPKIEIAADIQWIQKSKMGIMVVEMIHRSTELIANQKQVMVVWDAFTAGLRGSYRFLPSWTGALRLEFTSNTMPPKFTTPVSLDFNKFILQGGVAWHATRWFDLILEYNHIFFITRDITQSFFAPNANPVTEEEAGLSKPSPVGRYSGYSFKLTAGLAFYF